MTLKSMVACERTNLRGVTKRDSLIGAGVMIGASLVFSILGIAAKRGGWPATGEMLMSLAFPGSLTLSMPFWMMKSQPWKAKALVVGVMLPLLVAIGYLASLI